MEKAQRQRPQFFRQRDATALTLLIGPKIGHRVLHVMQQEDQRQNDDADDRVQQGVGAARALALQGRRECVQHISQQRHRQHQTDVGQCGVNDTLEEVLRALLAEGVFFLKIFHGHLPSFPTFR